MRFKVEYYNRVTKEIYWRTVTSDNHKDAMKIAERYARKGFIRFGMQQIY